MRFILNRQIGQVLVVLGVLFTVLAVMDVVRSKVEQIDFVQLALSVVAIGLGIVLMKKAPPTNWRLLQTVDPTSPRNTCLAEERRNAPQTGRS